MSFIVVDASVAAAHCLPDEDTATTEAIFDQLGDDGAIVPVIWPLELSNILVTAVRRGRLSRGQAAIAAQQILRFPIFVSQTTKEYGLLATHQVALEHGLTSYDASYLGLAYRRDLPLATFDKRLRRAAESAGVRVLW